MEIRFSVEDTGLFPLQSTMDHADDGHSTRNISACNMGEKMQEYIYVDVVFSLPVADEVQCWWHLEARS